MTSPTTRLHVLYFDEERKTRNLFLDIPPGASETQTRGAT